MNSKILFLDEIDLHQLGVDNPAFYFPIIKEVFSLHEKKEYIQPLKLYLRWEAAANRLNLMPAYVGGRFNTIGIKMVASVPANPKANGLPRGNTLLAIYSPDNGFPQALLSGTKISAMRTAGISSVAADYLARKDSQKLGLIGAGPISAAHIPMLLHVRPSIREVKVFDLDEQRANRFCQAVSKKWNIKVETVGSAIEATQDQEIVVAATSAVDPFIKGEWFSPGALFLNVGIMEAEVTALSRASYVVVDDFEQCTQKDCPLTRALRSEVIRSEEVVELGQIINGKKKSRTDDNQVILFNSIGLGMFDAACGVELYRKAKVQHLGQFLSCRFDIYDEFGIASHEELF
jgi:ornithine cyclodeaminase